jgi:integrase
MPGANGSALRTTFPGIQARGRLLPSRRGFRLRSKVQHTVASLVVSDRRGSGLLLSSYQRSRKFGPASDTVKGSSLPCFSSPVGEQYPKGFLEDAAFRKLLAACPKIWFHTLVEIGKRYGWRIGELLNLKIKHTCLHERFASNRERRRNGREVTMTKRASELLK